MKRLIEFLKMKQDILKMELYKKLISNDMEVTFDNNFLYAKGDIPILLVAHLDTVFDIPPRRLFYDGENDVLSGFFRGIGGDDRCGIYAIMTLLKNYRPHVLFTEGEEVGGIGAYEAVAKIKKPDIKYIVEFDRKGSNDCVFYDCGNDDFIKYVESFGFVKNFGTFTDISILGRKWDVASVNISSGYYNEHTSREYVKFKELKNNIRRVAGMIDALDKAPYFDYQDSYEPVDYLAGYSREELLKLMEQLYGNSKLEYDNGKSLSKTQGNDGEK